MSSRSLSCPAPLSAVRLGGLVLLVAAALAAMALPRAAARSLDVPYVPTPQVVVDKMLEMAEIKSGDRLIDLGSGDGRIPITAAKTYGVDALGVDLDPTRVKEANANAQKAQVTDKVTFVQQNLFETDLSEANVITMYLLSDVNLKLRPKLLGLKPGTRIVSHSFDMGDWKPEKTEKIDGRTVYMWTVGGGSTPPPQSTSAQ